ncbi:hypothetical protein EST38_g7250 [Candolleomyces aberdarensis]|uniref:NACHT domain-containing protein n=1 Tax=Candolleomyces aberdarensis TaxID=2316362 RepID=A0A4Q2DIX8_9AGAR|nr:hypothetical protein EST38_g7250 [Candolleomyces aberdarensis]
MDEPSEHDYSVGAFAGASKFGMKNVSIQSAGKDVNMNVYENCNISVNSAAADTEDNDIELLRRVADWLTTTSFRNIHSDALEKRTPGTGLWFTQTNEYHLWTRNNVKVLWGTGMPGAGKTILSALIVDHLQKEFSSQKRVPVIFAYCRYTEKYPTSQFLAAWIRQLLEYDPVTLRHISEAFAIHQRQDTWPSEAELHELLSTICTGFKKVYIVLDGLDEAQEEVKIRLLEGINTLPPNTRTLIMSRPLKSFECLVRSAVHIDIEARNEDIELFVEKKIAQMPRLQTMLAKKDSEKRRICKAIKEKSGGMFLVASLQIEALKGSMTPRALMNALETLPTTINDLYEHTLKRINAQSEAEVLLAKRAIVWLVHTLEPLPMNQLQHALATNLDAGTFDEDDITSGEFIFDACCGLVSRSHDSASPSTPLRLIHYTAHDFLKEACLLWFPAPHTFLSSICVVHLSAQLRYRNSSKGEVTFEWSSMWNILRPFFNYAYTHWGTHSRLSGQEKGLSPHVSQFVSRPLPYPWTHDSYFDMLGSHHLAVLYGLTDLLTNMSPSSRVTPKHRFTLLHLAAIGGHVESAKVVLERWPEMSIRDLSLDGRTPLMLASAFNCEEMVKFLLSIEPDDIETLNARAACGCTALASAINSGHTKIVELLASCQGVRLNVQTCRRSPLSWAASEGHITLVRQLLSDPEIDVNAQHAFTGYTALCYASRLGRPEAVEALLSRNEIDTHLGPRCGCTPLLLAASTNQLTIVALLLSNPNINIHARCMHSGTALSVAKNDALLKLLLSHGRILTNATADDIDLCLDLAARLGLEETFSRLVHGCLAPARSQMQSRVLVEAARRGHAAIVELALRFVDINATDRAGWTALDAAVIAGHTRIVSLLLSHKASPMHVLRALNSQLPNLALDRRIPCSLLLAAGNGHQDIVDSLLHVIRHNHGDLATLLAACQSGRDAVVQALLLQPDINVNVEDDLGRTPLAHAACNNHRSICHMLLVHPNFQLCAGKASPLMLAASRGYPEIVQLLLQPAYGLDIDVNVEDNRGWTPLAHAAWNDNRGVCHMLLAHPKVQPSAGKASPLVRAAFRGHHEIGQTLLQPIYGLDANTTDGGWTVLSAASCSGSMPVVKTLLARDDVDVNLGRHAPLIVAVCRGHTAIVKTLLADRRINVNIRDSGEPCGPTALFFACQHGSSEVVQALLSHPDINVNVRVGRGSARVGQVNPAGGHLLFRPPPSHPPLSPEQLWYSQSLWVIPSHDIYSTPLHVAAHAKDWHEILPLLLETKDLDPNTLNERGESALSLMLDQSDIERKRRIALFPGVLKLMASLSLASPNAIRKEPALLRNAARAGNIDAVKALLEHAHCDSTMNLTPALAAASRAGHADVVSLLLDVPEIDPNGGEPALPSACLEGSPIIVKHLLDHPRIDPNILTKAGYTALAAACYRGREQIISWLLSTKGINVNAGKYHPLMVAVQAGRRRVVAQLIEGCADIDVDQYSYSQEALRACFSPYFPRPTYRPFRERECWLKQSAYMNTAPKIVLHEPPLPRCFGRLAPRRTGPYAVGFLNGPVDRNADFGVTIRATFGEGDPILVYGVRAGFVWISKTVLSHRDIKINAQAHCGCTALIVGSFLRRHTILDLILARPDTDPTIRCPTHATAILAAAHRLYFDTVNKITSSPLRGKLSFQDTAACGCNLFICAARSGDEEIFLSFLPLTNWEDSPNVVDCKFGRTALLWASSYGQESIVKLLLSSLSIDSNHRDKDGNNALILAVKSGHEEVVRSILASPGVNINARNGNGDTALSLAVWYGHERIIRLLLARKDVDVRGLKIEGKRIGRHYTYEYRYLSESPVY